MSCQLATPNHTLIPEHYLPQSLLAIAEVIGLPAARTLMEQCGGTRVFVPKRLKVQHKLANLLGFEQARRLSDHFGGESLSIARGNSAIRAQRDAQIIRLYDAGATVGSLAREHQLTERQIYTILATPDRTPARRATPAGAQ